MKKNKLVDSFVEVELLDQGGFLKVVETLSRIGIASRQRDEQNRPTLVQSCHLLHKRDRDTDKSRYYVVHFKEMFLLDGREADFTEDDKARRNKIVQLLEEWGLVKIVDKQKVKEPVADISMFKIIKYSEKDNWNLTTKYTMGQRG